MACNDGFIITLGLKDDNLMNLLRFFFYYSWNYSTTLFATDICYVEMLHIQN